MYRLVKNNFYFCVGKTVVLLSIFVVSPFFVYSQAEDSLVEQETRKEVWPELDIYYRFNEKFRLFTSLSATQLKSSSYTDGGLSVNLDYFALPCGAM